MVCETGPQDSSLSPHYRSDVGVCQKVFYLVDISPIASLLLPKVGIPAFPASMDDPVFRKLIEDLTCRATIFVHQSQWAGFTALSSMPHLGDLGFWRTMQLSHFLHSLPGEQASTRPLTEFEDCISHWPP